MEVIKMKLSRMGVMYLLAHLIITLGIMGVYAYSVAIGHPDETSKVLLYTIVGYWFGAVGMDKIKPASQAAPVTTVHSTLTTSTPTTQQDQTGGVDHE
jgi:hypothetical protein